MAYVTEIDIFDAQCKDNDLSTVWPPYHSGMCVQGSHASGKGIQ